MNTEYKLINKNVFLGLVAVLAIVVSNSGLAKVTGLPDFTSLVEDAGPAVVNIRVTQFGEDFSDEPDSAQGHPNPEDMPEFFRRFFDVPGMPS